MFNKKTKNQILATVVRNSRSIYLVGTFIEVVSLLFPTNLNHMTYFLTISCGTHTIISTAFVRNINDYTPLYVFSSSVIHYAVVYVIICYRSISKGIPHGDHFFHYKIYFVNFLYHNVKVRSQEHV